MKEKISTRSNHVETPNLKNFYEVPELPKWEIAVYFCVWIGHSVFAFYHMIVVSKWYHDKQFITTGFTEDGGEYSWLFPGRKILR